MRAAADGLRAFFRIAGRPAMVLWVPLLFGCAAMVLLALRDPRLLPRLVPHAGILALLAYPSVAGFLAGQVIQELQHCTFAWTLPGVRGKTLLGFVAGGAVTTALVFLAASGSSDVALSGLAVGFGGYCLGSLWIDPLSRAASLISPALLVVTAVFSEDLAELCAHRPLAVFVLAAAVAGACLWRVFGVATFRRKPFRPTLAVVGALSFGQARRYERERLAWRKPAQGTWTSDYLGTDLGRWLGALFRVRGDGKWRGKTLLNSLLPLAAVIGLHARLEAGEGGFLGAFLTAIHQTILMPPHLPAVGEKDPPYAMVALILAGVGAAVAYQLPVAPRGRLHYPLSRPDRARLAWWGSGLRAASTLGSHALVLFGVAMAAGWWASLDLRLDYVPLLARAVAATWILLPWVDVVRLRVGEWPSDSADTKVGLAVGYVLVIGIVWAWSFGVPRMSASPAVEIAATAALLGVSQAAYRWHLERFFATADLV